MIFLWPGISGDITVFQTPWTQTLFKISIVQHNETCGMKLHAFCGQLPTTPNTPFSQFTVNKMWKKIYMMLEIFTYFLSQSEEISQWFIQNGGGNHLIFLKLSKSWCSFMLESYVSNTCRHHIRQDTNLKQNPEMKFHQKTKHFYFSFTIRNNVRSRWTDRIRNSFMVPDQFKII